MLKYISFNNFLLESAKYAARDLPFFVLISMSKHEYATIKCFYTYMLYANVISDIYLYFSISSTTNFHKTQTKILRIHDVSYFHYDLRKVLPKVLVCCAASDQC